MNNTLINLAIAAAMHVNKYRVRRPLINATKTPGDVQNTLLLSILRKNADTEIGKKFHFSKIESFSDYQKTVPVHEYDDLEHYIENQIDGAAALTQTPPVYYARTSGSTGRFKNIPLTPSGLNQVQSAQQQLAISLWKSTQFFSGKILGFAGSAAEGELRNGCSYGSVSGTTYRSLSRIVASKFAIPAKALPLRDIEAKYQIYALTVIGCKNLSGMVSANPSSILKLVKFINDNLEHLLKTLSGADTSWLRNDALTLLPEVVINTDKHRLKQLQATFDKDSKITPEALFPALSTIATWTGGSCGTAIRQLKTYLPENIHFVEYGYGASEFMGSVNVNAIDNVCIPQLTQHVYEFVQRDLWEQKRPHFITVEHIVPGSDYYVFVTTQSGLYRYHINDIVRAGTPVNNCPALYFLQKGKGVTNITGEKLSEYQLIASMERTMEECALVIGGYLALANVEKSRYDIYIEAVPAHRIDSIALAIDSNLRDANIEYNDKRHSERLKASNVFALTDGAFEKIKQWSLDRGVREVQYKPTVLDYSNTWKNKLAPLLVQPNG